MSDDIDAADDVDSEDGDAAECGEWRWWPGYVARRPHFGQWHLARALEPRALYHVDGKIVTEFPLDRIETAEDLERALRHYSAKPCCGGSGERDLRRALDHLYSIERTAEGRIVGVVRRSLNPHSDRGTR